MKHPEILLIPVFMLADYLLTIAGAVRKEKKYDQHFNVEHYELNPVWQKPVAAKKWVNPRHLLLTGGGSLILIFLAESGQLPDFFLAGFLGCLLVFFGMVIGRHLSNLLIFRHMMRRPLDISGQVTLTHSLVLSMSLYQYVAVFVPIILIAVFAPSPFIFGAVLAVILQVLIHLIWISKYRKTIKPSTMPGVGDDG